MGIERGCLVIVVVVVVRCEKSERLPKSLCMLLFDLLALLVFLVVGLDVKNRENCENVFSSEFNQSGETNTQKQKSERRFSIFLCAILGKRERCLLLL